MDVGRLLAQHVHLDELQKQAVVPGMVRDAPPVRRVGLQRTRQQRHSTRPRATFLTNRNHQMTPIIPSTPPPVVKESLTSPQPAAPDWVERAAKDARAIITYSINRHVAMKQEHRRWLADDISTRIEDILKHVPAHPVASPAGVEDAKRALEDLLENSAVISPPDQDPCFVDLQVRTEDYDAAYAALDAPAIPQQPVASGEVADAIKAAIAFADIPSDFTCGQARALLARILAAVAPFLAGGEEET